MSNIGGDVVNETKLIRLKRIDSISNIEEIKSLQKKSARWSPKYHVGNSYYWYG